MKKLYLILTALLGASALADVSVTVDPATQVIIQPTSAPGFAWAINLPTLDLLAAFAGGGQ